MLRAFFLVPILLSALSAQTATSYVASAGYAFPDPKPVARGQVITLFVRGLQVPNASAAGSPWPTMLGGVTVAVANPPTPAYPTMLPIFSVFSSPAQCASGNYNYCNTTAVTVQIPVEPACIPANFPDSCSTFSGPLTNLIVNAGVTSQMFPFVVVGGSPHVLNTCDTIFGTGGICTPVITHANGTAVSTSAPAQPGEIVTLYAVGVGPTQNGTGTGQAAAAPDPVVAPPYLSFGFWIDTPAEAGPAPSTLSESGQPTPAAYAGLVSGYVGLYQINVSLPATLPASFHACQGFADTNLRIFLGSGPAPSQTTESPFVDLCMAQ
jgi:uncharacterized protein (TIGR03437 family)